jgi:hypothetical protein
MSVLWENLVAGQDQLDTLYKETIVTRPLKNAQICAKSRKIQILTASRTPFIYSDAFSLNWGNKTP